MNDYLERISFKDIDLNEPFFNSLKKDYYGFEKWFNKKANEQAYILRLNQFIHGFLYLKYEDGPITDVTPEISCKKALKIGTFKVNPHGTRLGERFIKKALDYAVKGNVELCYVTIFEKHQTLVKLFEKYGFIKHGVKTNNDTESVYVKSLSKINNDLLLDYPLIKTKERKKYILSIYPEYHSIMFPDSILKNEHIDILEDVTITNSIHKTYVTRMKVNQVKPGDILVMYRTATKGMKAEYTAVATSVCVVEEIRSQYDFNSFEEFYKYATTYSIFDKSEIESYYNLGSSAYAIKMTYNAAFSRRLIRKYLIENIGLERDSYWGFFKLTDTQFNRIIKEGEVSESIIID
ncbi:N-acetyltransferase [Bacillus sp. 03113]|uniref:N-acetyltransferase n=1 Tax=Bacillus sp. 03113 TaxID=2578211 RepID=UPI0011427932|nr:N-acetyltransferase [Bacillus sp. 03113]